MAEDKKAYRQILKATSLFGGVQIFQILIAIVRSKFVAILLGPTGMGIMGLLTSTTGLVSGLTNFGLGTIAVKSISEAVALEDERKISEVVKILKRLVWLTGLLGMIVVLVFSSKLSVITFGNTNYKLAFIWISITLLFNQLTSGELAVLQSLRRLNYLARANILGSLTGLFVSIPLYYWLGVKGIVPVIIIMALATFLISHYFEGKVVLPKMDLSWGATILQGKKMMGLGFIFSLSAMVGLLTSFLIRVFISHAGGVDDVGYFTAGFTLVNTYVGMVFTAMGTDYYPALARVQSDNDQCRVNINQQSEIAILLLSPILIVLLVFVNIVIVILYSSSFLVISGMIYWASLGIFFKAASWAIAFVFLAKGKGKLYFWNELLGSLYMLVFGVIGFHQGGLTGLGMAFMVSFFLYLVQVYMVARKNYGFSFHSSFIKIFAVQFFLALMTFMAVNFLESPFSFIPGIALIAASSWYSFKELNRRIAFSELIQKLFKKIKGK